MWAHTRSSIECTLLRLRVACKPGVHLASLVAEPMGARHVMTSIGYAASTASRKCQELFQVANCMSVWLDVDGQCGLEIVKRLLNITIPSSVQESAADGGIAWLQGQLQSLGKQMRSVTNVYEKRYRLGRDRRQLEYTKKFLTPQESKSSSERRREFGRMLHAHDWDNLPTAGPWSIAADANGGSDNAKLVKLRQKWLRDIQSELAFYCSIEMQIRLQPWYGLRRCYFDDTDVRTRNLSMDDMKARHVLFKQDYILCVLELNNKTTTF